MIIPPIVFDTMNSKTVPCRTKTNKSPLMAKDFAHTGKKVGDWASKPVKRALEYLYCTHTKRHQGTRFDFNYLIKCYVSADKRQFGYFALPIVWDGRLVARMDCKAERKKALLHIHHLALEPTLTNTDAFALALSKELVSFLQFNNCITLQLHKTTPDNFKSVLKTVPNPIWDKKNEAIV